MIVEDTINPHLHMMRPLADQGPGLQSKRSTVTKKRTSQALEIAVRKQKVEGLLIQEVLLFQVQIEILSHKTEEI